MYKVLLNGNVINDPHTVTGNAITGTVTKEINSIDKFEFTVYPTNSEYDKIFSYKGIVEIYDILKNDELVFKGRVLTVQATMDKKGMVCKKVVCESELAYLCDTVCDYHYYTKVSVQTLLTTILENHNSQTTNDKKILLGRIYGSTKFLFDCEIGYVSTWNTIAQNLDGELRLRYEGNDRYLDYTTTQFTKGSTTTIELAVNMIASTQRLDPSKVVTVAYPLGARIGDNNERISAQPVSSYELVREYGRICAAITFDNVTSKTELRSLAEQWLENQKPIKKQYQVEAVDLSLIKVDYESFNLGTTYHIVNPLIGLDDDIRLIKKILSIEDRLNNKLTFGDKFETLTKNMISSGASLSKQIASNRRSESALVHDVVNNQTSLMRGADGGYKYDRLDSNGKPIETFYLNAADIMAATAALRINQNGIGFWKESDGGNALDGPYTSAWTIDGVFNTDFILAQTLTGLKINNGSGTFTVDASGNVVANSLTSNNARITGGTININTGSSSYDVISMKYSNGTDEWTAALSPIELNLSKNGAGGHIQVQSGGIFFKWNDETKLVLDSNYGSITSYTGGNVVFGLDTNNKFVMVHGKIYTEDILIKQGSGYISVKQYIDNHP